MNLLMELLYHYSFNLSTPFIYFLCFASIPSGISKADNILKNISILDAKDAITNFDDPAFAIKHKKESSIVKAYDYMKEKENSTSL